MSLSEKKNSFFALFSAPLEKFKGRNLCVPLCYQSNDFPPRRYSQQRTSKHHPVPAAVHCCDELFTQMCSIAPGDPIFMSYSFVFVFGFTRPPRFLLFYFVVIKKILSTNFFFSSCSSSGCRRSLSVNSNQFPT